MRIPFLATRARLTDQKRCQSEKEKDRIFYSLVGAAEKQKGEEKLTAAFVDWEGGSLMNFHETKMADGVSRMILSGADKQGD